jgi:hypothetical protein
MRLRVEGAAWGCLLRAATLLIVFCCLVIGCSNPLMQYRHDGSGGMGYFTLSLKMEPVRSIVPAAPVPDTYTLIFYEANTGNEKEKIENLSKAAVGSAIYLETGTYDLEVFACLNSSLVASGKLAGITISSGAGTSGTVVLKTITNVNGTFSWNIALPAMIDSAIMTIEDLTPAGKLNPQVFDLLGSTSPNTNNDTLSLPSGNYQVTVSLSKADTDIQPLIHYEVLRIYGNLTSPFSITFTDELFYTRGYRIDLVYDKFFCHASPLRLKYWKRSTISHLQNT